MFKHQILIAALFGLMSPTRGQKAQRPEMPWSLSISAGCVVPIGAFASTDLMTSDAGFARVGAGVQLALTYWPTRSIGVILAAAGQINPVSSYTEDDFRFPGTITSQSDPWRAVRLLTGVTVRKGLSKNLALDLKCLGGALKTSYPGHTYYYSYNGASEPWPATPIPWTFAWEADAGLDWRLSGTVFLVFDTSYQGCMPWDHPIHCIQLSLGAGIRFK